MIVGYFLLMMLALVSTSLYVFYTNETKKRRKLEEDLRKEIKDLTVALTTVTEFVNKTYKLATGPMGPQGPMGLGCPHNMAGSLGPMNTSGAQGVQGVTGVITKKAFLNSVKEEFEKQEAESNTDRRAAVKATQDKKEAE